MSEIETELEQKVQEAVEKMFHTQTVSCDIVNTFADGKQTEVRSGRVSVLDTFEKIQHTLEFREYSLDVVSEHCIKITKIYSGPRSATFGGRPLKSSTYTYVSGRDKLRPILEYLHWWHNARPIPSFSFCMEVSPEKPSYLPALVMHNFGLSVLNQVDERVLSYYGFRRDMLSKLKTQYYRRVQNRDWGSWLDFVSVNELWFNSPAGTKLPDLVNDSML